MNRLGPIFILVWLFLTVNVSCIAGCKLWNGGLAMDIFLKLDISPTAACGQDGYLRIGSIGSSAYKRSDGTKSVQRIDAVSLVKDNGPCFGPFCAGNSPVSAILSVHLEDGWYIDVETKGAGII